jgi:hypothetical protein
MSLKDDLNYSLPISFFPQPDVPTNGNYGSNFGKEQMYYGYSPSSAAIDAANAAAGEKTYSSGKYVYNPATGQYTWVPAGAATPTPTTPTTPVTTLEPPGGAENGQSPGPGGGSGIPGATMVGGISGPTTGLASLANSAAARLGNMSIDPITGQQKPGLYGSALRGISDALARNVDPSFSHEGRTGRGVGSVDIDGKTVDKTDLGSFNIGPTGLTAIDAPTAAESQARADAVSGATAAPIGPDSGPSSGAESGSGYGEGLGAGYDKANGGVVGRFAHGGLGSLGGYSDGGRLLRGPGDGVSDSIPATIGRAKKPARLADGEFVVPARIVSELGNGSTEAGARKLYAMLARIQAGRKKSVGRGKVAVNSRMDKHLPA